MRHDLVSVETFLDTEGPLPAVKVVVLREFRLA
jgi:hypothetical protein